MRTGRPGAVIPAHGLDAIYATSFFLRRDATIGTLIRALKAQAFAYVPEERTQAIADADRAFAAVRLLGQ